MGWIDVCLVCIGEKALAKTAAVLFTSQGVSNCPQLPSHPVTRSNAVLALRGLHLATTVSQSRARQCHQPVK